MPEVGTKLIFENERVRVWEFTLQPGESIEAHHHDHDYFFYPIEGGTLEVTRADGITRLTLSRRGLFPQRRRQPRGKKCRRPSLSRGVGRTQSLKSNSVILMAYTLEGPSPPPDSCLTINAPNRLSAALLGSRRAPRVGGV